MKVLHVSTECYPAAKAGGMGDVVGTLPRYLNRIGVEASVLIPKYKLPWFENNEFETVFYGGFSMENEWIPFSIQKVVSDDLGFPFYCADIPGKFDRFSIYLDTDGEGYRDEVARNISFQRATIEWLINETSDFELIHCHDHMTGLIPFFMKHAYGFESLKSIPSFFTIHNSAYHGMFGWEHNEKMPMYEGEHQGKLEWDDQIHSLACAIKCAWRINTVSPSYMDEISHMNHTLTWLYNHEKEKTTGILNGIDTEAWDPKTDPLLHFRRTKTWDDFKMQNKKAFAEEYGLDATKPLISFIGRFSNQKGVDVIPEAVKRIIKERDACFVILGNGNRYLENDIRILEELPKVKALIMYNEAVAHQIYAASDFLMMPSRFEPCGLNQMFAFRYGTIPIVRATGGLKDTVLEDPEKGTGFVFDLCSSHELYDAINRALDAYDNPKEFKKIRDRGVRKNFSWEKSAKQYANEYKKLKDG